MAATLQRFADREKCAFGARIPAMPGGQRERSAATIRRDVYRLFLSLTRVVIDPLLAGQLAGAVYDEPAPDAGNTD
jgi:hypothetical protein